MSYNIIDVRFFNDMSKTRKIFVKLFSLSTFIFFAGCGLTAPSAESVSEIALKVQTGLLGSAYTISFADNGTARCECLFYKLRENGKPNLDYVENICTDLYHSNEAAFIAGDDGELKGIFTGKIAARQFGNLVQTVRQSGFFSIFDKDSGGLVLDSPPNFVKVIYEGKTKEVSDANHDLSEIEGAIIRTAKETKWEKKKDEK